MIDLAPKLKLRAAAAAAAAGRAQGRRRDRRGFFARGACGAGTLATTGFGGAAGVEDLLHNCVKSLDSAASSDGNIDEVGLDAWGAYNGASGSREKPCVVGGPSPPLAPAPTPLVGAGDMRQALSQAWDCGERNEEALLLATLDSCEHYITTEDELRRYYKYALALVQQLMRGGRTA